jgi:RimJ/RimL family protein N-acetyltransferase
MRLRSRYAFAELGLNKLKSMHIEGNVASGRAMASAGYRRVGVLRQEFYRDGRWHDAVATELLREDWERSGA